MDGRAFAEPAFYFNTSSVSLDDPFADVQSQARTTIFTGPGLIYTVEAVKNMGDFVLGYSNTGIFYGNGNLAVLEKNSDVYMPPFWCIPYCIVDKIGENLP